MNKKRFRKTKITDQSEVTKACKILNDEVDKHPEIEPALWVSACFSLIATCYITNGHSYDNFCSELEGVRKCYKTWWEEQT